ncbi:phosphate signaling complex protein PhoU [Pontibacillus salicampi]|uniref:Phosphate-specific transport system accessory protein PhoU n=1 Tax=Pontibacillus salicampi TaxID=1449801 RepID=A0ABV6LPP9_9BACI
METRLRFHNDLESLKNRVKVMASHTTEAFDQSMDALYERDLTKARSLIQRDEDLNQEETQIKEEAILLIAKQQPVASDLRRLLIAIQVASELERMADHAKNISKSTLHIGNQHSVQVPFHIRKMYTLASEMIEIAFKAFDNEDVTLARKLAQMDDEMDELYSNIIENLMQQSVQSKGDYPYIMQYGFVARYIERFADHITNIGEQVYYLVKGESKDLS